MRGAAAQRAGARIEHAVAACSFAVARLLRVVGIVAHEEIPAHGRVFRGERMEGRHVVVLGQPAPAHRRGSPPASSTTTRMPASASRAASVPPPAPEPTTT